MRGLATVPSYVVMQPTTLCNLDCAYCYLPLRAAERRMPVSVAEAVAGSVNPWAADGRFSVVWHGGEPLAAGREQLAALIAPFGAAVEHHVQTNATLIDDAWCEFFAERQIRVSVSVDGPREHNGERTTRGGRPAYDRILRGVAALRRHGLPFSALAVVSRPAPGLATELYEYFLSLGCDVLGINIEETEGVNTRTNAHDPATVTSFWAELVAAWRRDPRIHLREVEWSLRYVAATLDGEADAVLPRRLDPIPTVGYDGSVTVLSPELAGFTDARYGDFSSGNVLRTPLVEILAAAERTSWVGEFLTGVEACRSSCAYFGFCGGGHAANRYFEHGRFDGTETEHCRNSKIRLLDGVLEHARDHQGPAAGTHRSRADGSDRRAGQGRR
ncbi:MULTISPECIES: cyclophane-forming radical SAM peptide maturase AmcB [Micromonospora]|nr:cyclophane-forming radical SAM peptide maturase AmcB [Micromonospora yangpuensis]